jgi:hypothetical protein
LIEHLIDLDRFPLNYLYSRQGRALVIRCQEELAGSGRFRLVEPVKQNALKRCASEIEPRLNSEAFIHRMSPQHLF